jgi:hypothetical protein
LAERAIASAANQNGTGDRYSGTAEAKDTAMQSEPATQDFADYAKTVHTIPYRRKPAPSQYQ